MNQRVATAMLKKLGGHVDLAGDGGEALRMIELLPYDLVLMDCQMPDMDGYEATRRIRASESDETHLLIIAMTGNAMAGDRERCLKAGMDDYISKPVKLPGLAATLARWAPPDTSRLSDEVAVAGPTADVASG